MKTLHLIRHAKSSWDHPEMTDIERPLNNRGRRSCEVMAEPIYEAGCHFSHVFCSPAKRAQSTIGLLSEILDGRVQWETHSDLYTFASYELKEWIIQLANELDDVVVVGHNPAFTELCNQLTQSFFLSKDKCSEFYIENIPTCGYVQLKNMEAQSWEAIFSSPCELTSFIKPKDFLPSK